MALGHIHLRFAWQAWHLWHWAGSGGALGPVLVAGDAAALCVAGVAWSHPPSFCVAGVALMALGWLWWRAWAGFGRRPLCMAGVALGDIHLPFPWQAWHLVTSTFVLRGRRGTYGTGLALVAPLGRFGSEMTPRHFVWQAWHLVTSTFVLRGRRGTYGTGLALVSHALHLRFAWQAWHLWRWAGSGGALGPVLVAGDAAAFCVAGVALGDIHLPFAWQAWRLVTSTFVLRSRRGTYGTGLVLVAPLGRFCSQVTPRHFAWQAWHLVTSTFVLRGQRGTWSHPPSTLRGRRGTYGTGLALVARLGPVLVAGDAAALCVAGVALGDIHLRFAWPAWHLWHWAGSGVTRPIFVTHHLCHTTSVTHYLSQTPSFTPNFVTHHLSHTTSFTHHLSPHHLSHTTFSHTTLSHTIFHTPSLTHHFVTHHL